MQATACTQIVNLTLVPTYQVKQYGQHQQAATRSRSRTRRRRASSNNSRLPALAGSSSSTCLAQPTKCLCPCGASTSYNACAPASRALHVSHVSYWQPLWWRQQQHRWWASPRHMGRQRPPVIAAINTSLQYVSIESGSSEGSSFSCEPTHSSWVSPDGTCFEVLELHALQHHHCDSGGNSFSSRPPVVLVHGLFRAAWYWAGTLMPMLAAAGFDCYALSLRGQGGSEIWARSSSSHKAAMAASSTDSNNIASDGDYAAATAAVNYAAAAAAAAGHDAAAAVGPDPFPAGVPLAVNVADIGAFIASRQFSQPPVLVGHSLGGMFVQEYLHKWHQQQQEAVQSRQGAQQQAAAQYNSCTSSNSRSSAHSHDSSALVATLPHLSAPLPQLSGAVLLASACAGTAMSFAQFAADVGPLEFLHQLYIVFSNAHLKDLDTAKYCWWETEIDTAEAAAHLAAIRSSSKLFPYVAQEVSGWHPPPPDAAARRLLPPVLALGNVADRIIRPFQVAAAGDHWGARVVLLNNVTHDMLLGPQAEAVSQRLLQWLLELPAVTVAATEATRLIDTNPTCSSSSSASTSGSKAVMDSEEQQHSHGQAAEVSVRVRVRRVAAA